MNREKINNSLKKNPKVSFSFVRVKKKMRLDPLKLE